MPVCGNLILNYSAYEKGDKRSDLELSQSLYTYRYLFICVCACITRSVMKIFVHEPLKNVFPDFGRKSK